ncbi:MAG: hypothetical protein J0I48_02285 [Devosia sp.]|uniref:hypothetical protein n=1 Tax=Devosia sp. 66-22 TaxID=1895753 RepID=UPI000AADB051|nr:hypothetical protein [Devosia sp. 66-22]MBN9345018.1 hypothetical protein [Devosia sp.]
MNIPAHSTASAKRANFAPMPKSVTEWGHCYYVPVTFTHLEPRACEGETLVFDRAKAATRGDLVCIRPKADPNNVLVGVLVSKGAKVFRVALSLDGSAVVTGKLNTAELHPAIGVMSTRLDTPEGREVHRRNVAKRQAVA